MAEESMLSTAESGVEPPPGAAGGAGAQAEMITKKLANYWCLIGSIPLVMFLLVAVPTIFYVKKFSEYVNAEYCESKSCKDLADAILKAGSVAQACAPSFSAHVCSSKADFMAAALKKLHDEALKELPEGAPVPKGNEVLPKVKVFLANCIGSTLGDDSFDPFYLSAIGGDKKFDATGQVAPATLSGVLSSYGCDGLVRAVAFVGNSSGNQDMVATLELSAPVHDFYPRMLMAVADANYDKIAKSLEDFDEEGFTPALDAARAVLDKYIIENARTSRQTRPKLMTVADLKALPNDVWNWEEYLKPINEASQDSLTDDTLLRLVHPKYLIGLNAFLKEQQEKNNLFLAQVNVIQQVDAYLFGYGRLAIKGFDANKQAYCLLHTDRLFPGAVGHNSFYMRAAQFGAPAGINPGGSNDSAMVTFLDAQVREMLDSMAFSYSLSTSATEENRIAFYHKTLNITTSPGFFNGTDGLSSVEMALLSEPVDASADADVHGMCDFVRQQFKTVYWIGLKNKTTTYFKYRNPYHSLYSTFTATENHLYVPMGAFTTPIFRNSQKNRLFAATSGYMVMTGIMKAISLTDAMVVKGQLMPENWIGYSWTRKIERYSECLGADRKENGTMSAFTDAFMVGAVTPTLRYFRRKIFEKAYPRPEFRIDWVSDLSSTQLFFYAWAMLHCGSKEGKELIDVAAKNNPYFTDSFGCQKGSKMYKEKQCILWNTTRRDY